MFRKNLHSVLCRSIAILFILSHGLSAEGEPAKTPAAPTAGEKKAKRAVKLAEDGEEIAPPEKDPKDYQLSTKRLTAELSEQDTHPYDRGEHYMISALFGAIGGGVVGGWIGLSQYSTANETTSKETLYTFAGVGAGVGVLAGITTAIFETGKIEQFAIGKFLLKYSWYGAAGGGLLGAGIGIIPYSKSGDTSDLLNYSGYGAAIGLVAGLTFFAIELPTHLKLYTYRRDDQSAVAIVWAF